MVEGKSVLRTNRSWNDMFDWAYSGVDHTLPGNGGQDCVDFLSMRQRVIESVLASAFALFVMWKAYPKLTLPKFSQKDVKVDGTGKRILLVTMCLTLGIELGFKFSTRQMIWIFNPCHVATIIQIYLLAAAPSKMVTAVFRLHMHMLTGAPIAILFPVVNTRLLPFETEVYYVQHILMLVIPFYLMKTGGVYIPEDLFDFSWGFMSLGILYLYHFIPLQILAVVSAVNLNNMLCPAISDPFHGSYYRLCALSHQTLLIPTLGKVYVWVAKYLPVWQAQSKSHIVEEPCFYRESASREKSSLIQHNCDETQDDRKQQRPINGKVKSHQRCHSNGHLKLS